MEIKSLRLDFLTLIIHINITKAQNISEHIRAYVARDLGRALPGPRVTGAARCLGRATQATRSRGRDYRQGVLEVLLSFFCFFLSGFLFGCSKNHKVWIFMFFPQI